MSLRSTEEKALDNAKIIYRYGLRSWLYSLRHPLPKDVVYRIDAIEIRNSQLIVFGWLSVGGRAASSCDLIVEEKGEERRIPAKLGIERADVESVYKKPLGTNIGFYARTFLSEKASAKLFLEYQDEQGSYRRIFLGRRRNKTNSLSDVRKLGLRATLYNRKNSLPFGTSYSVDLFTWKEQELCLEGWMAVEGAKVDKMSLLLESKSTSRKIEILNGISRKDIARIYGGELDEDIGFFLKAFFDTYKKTNAFIEYETESHHGKIMIGVLKKSLFSKARYIIGKISYQNLKKFLRYILTGQIGQIKEVFSRSTFSTLSSGIPDTDLYNWLTERAMDVYAAPQEVYKEKVDLIVPVYNGFEYLPKLFSSIKKTKMSYRLLITDDHSPDARVWPYLQSLSEKDPAIQLFRNEKNLGFVSTVNRMLEKIEGHAVLLNTDIELPEFWLERMIQPIIQDEKVASVTPFSNAATLCSFPTIGLDNPLYESLSAEEIDQIFRTIRPAYPKLPTGVGFCMALNHAAVQKVGLLDAETFEKGYGEENDWCQRTIAAGYHNVQADNLYVYHKHGGSFLSKEKKRLIEQNGQALAKKHPNYHSDVARFFEQDPTRPTREVVAIKLNRICSGNEAILYFDHNLGGGASAYLDKEIARLASCKRPTVIVRYDAGHNFYLFYYYYKQQQFSFRFIQFEQLNTLIQLTGVAQIFINELVSYPGLSKLLKTISKWKQQYGATLHMLCHDYYFICPTVNLMNDKTAYCGVQEGECCNRCIRNRGLKSFGTIEDWRHSWGSFLANCDEVRAFSQDTATHIKKAYPDLQNITVVPHKVDYVPAINGRVKRTTHIQVGILGALALHKGFQIVKKMAEILEEKDLPIDLVLIGEPMDEISSSHFKATGRYLPEEVVSLTLQHDIDLFLAPSIVPETFSYTTEEAIQMGYPVMSFDLGAPAERIKQYAKGKVISEMKPEVAVEEILSFATELGVPFSTTKREKKVLFLVEEHSFATRYRCEHLAESLLIKGISSDIRLVKNVNRCDPKEYRTIVLYRCLMSDGLDEFIRKAKEGKIPVYFDIDDYVFDYQSIRHLDFLQGEEYKTFETYCNKINETIQRCDKLITSTETLKKLLTQAFPSKQTLLNRNSASAAMYTLSRRAVSLTKKDPDRIVLGYFSGSKTHDKDFSVAAPAILKVMEKYQNVYLKIGGCLNLDERFYTYKSRIYSFGFKDWRELPHEIASVDINLMPLEDDLFQNCKSENKWMEAALVGVPTIASANVELERIIAHGQNGLLCNTAEEWEEALETLIGDEQKRNSMGDAAFSKVQSSYLAVLSESEALHSLVSEQ